MPTLYDLLPPDVKAANPPESLDAPAAAVLLRQGLVPDGYDPAKATLAGRTLAGLIPHMTQMRAITNRVRAAQQAPALPVGRGGGGSWAPEPETSTQRAYSALGPGVAGGGTAREKELGTTRQIPAAALQAPLRIAAGAAQAVPNLSPFLAAPYSTKDLVPPAKNLPEHAQDVAGQLLGFGATATALGAIPGVSAAGAAGATGALQEGTLRERAIRGATMAATAGASETAGAAIAGNGAGALRKLAAQVPPAIGFGAFQPVAEAAMNGKPLPTPADWAKGSGEMLVINLITHGAGAMHEALAAAPPDVAAHAQAVADAVRPPRGLTPLGAEASARLSQRLSDALAGKNVGLTLPSGQRAAVRIEAVTAYNEPEGGQRVHLVISDPSGSAPVPVTFRSLPQMRDAIEPLPPKPDVTPVVPPAEVQSALNQRSVARQAQRPEVASVLGEQAAARLAPVEKSLAGLLEHPVGKGDKDYRRWASRVERLTSERDALRKDAELAPRPAPVAPAAQPVVEGGGPAAVSAPERGSGTAAPPPPEPTDLKPLEQGMLPGMPKPKIPGGATRSNNDNSADVVAGMGKTPEPSRQTDLLKPAAEPERSASEWARELARIRERKPRPANKLFGANGPTSEQKAAHDEAMRKWNSEYRRASVAHKAALAAQQAAPIPPEAPHATPVPHPDRATYFVAQQLNRFGAAKEALDMVKTGATDSEIRAMLDRHWKEGGDGNVAHGIDKHGPWLEYPHVPVEGEPAGRITRVKIPAGKLVRVIRQGLHIPEKPTAPAPAGEPAAPLEKVGPRGYKAGERVRTPYVGKSSYFGKKSTRASDVGHVVSYDEGGRVTVDVERGQGVERHTFDETALRRVPKPAVAGAAEKKVYAGVRERIGGDVDKARAIIDEYDAKANELQRSIGGDMNHPDYPAVRRRWVAATRIADAARSVLNELGGNEDASFDVENLPASKPEDLVHAEAAPSRAGRSQTSRASTGWMGAANRQRGQRGIPIAPAVGDVPTAVEGRTLPATELPKGAETPADPLAHASVGKLLDRFVKEKGGKAVEAFRTVGREIASAANPLHAAATGEPNVRRGVDALFRAKGSLEKALFANSRNQKRVEKMFDRLTPEQRFSYLDRMENASDMDPRLAEIAASHRQRFDQGYAAIKKYKPGLPYIENYFVHLWKNKDAAEAFLTAKRPLGGKQAMLKARVLDDIRAGLEKGLVLADDNPERMVQAWEHEARKLVMIHELLLDPHKVDPQTGEVTKQGAVMQELGMFKRFPLSARPGKGVPEDFAEPQGRWAQTYLNPVQEITEYFDKHMVEGLQGVAKAMGVRTERKMALRGGALGLAWGDALVQTKFATETHVLAHEIGHAIDAKFGMQREFIKRSKPYQDQMRALADLRSEGENISGSRKAYLHKAEEKMAVMTQAFIHMPERFREVAPDLYERYVKFIASHKETAPLLTLKPSLVHGEATGEVHAGGPVLGGKYWGQKDLVRMLDNYMSGDDIRKNLIGRTLLNSRNRLNSMQLGFSAFHATNLAFIATTHRFSIGLSKVLHGQVARGLKDIARAPLAVPDYLRTGAQFYKGDPSLAHLEDDYFTGGARLFKPEAEQSSFDKAVRFTVQKRWLAEMKASGGLAARHAAFAGIEATTRGIMWGAERMKVAAFRDLLAWSLEKNAAKLEDGTVTRDELARLALRDVDDRMGLLNYDNLFWNNTLKTAVMLAVRAPGWTLGTARSLGGAALVDLPRAIGNAATGKAPVFTDRMAFTSALIMLQLGLGGAITYLSTGKRPKNLHEMLHPIGPDGNAQTLPTDLRTAEGWVQGVTATIKGDPKGADRLYHSAVTGPIPRAVEEFMHNQDFRGPIRKPGHNALQQTEDVMKWLFGTVAPISVTSAPKGATPAQRVLPFLGVTPYHAPADHTRRHSRGHRRAG